MARNEGQRCESGAPEAISGSALLSELQDIRAELARQDIRCCGCAHEWIIAERHNTESKYRAVFNGPNSRAAALTVLCPQEVRQNSPMCAHATESFAPDPFGPQLRRLVALGIMDQTLLDAMTDVAHTIADIDVQAAIHRWAGREHQRSILAKKLPYLQMDDASKAQWVEDRMKQLMPEAVAMDESVQQQTLTQQKSVAQQLEAHRRMFIALIDMTIARLISQSV